MALKRSKARAGTLVVLEHSSRILKGNPLGDPHVRRLGVWLPPQYDDGARLRRFPVLYDLVGFTGSGLAHANWKAFGDNVPERAARLIHEGRMGPAIIVLPDCFTALGGNQYVNSSTVGDYADYLTREIIPFVDREFRTASSREHRGCFGKSSGGYGAMLHGMKYAKYWGAIANHSGDAFFEFVYWHDWPNTLNELAKHRRPKRKAGAYAALSESRRKGLAEESRRGTYQCVFTGLRGTTKISGGMVVKNEERAVRRAGKAFVDAFRAMLANEAPGAAAAISYFSLLALFPAILVLIALADAFLGSIDLRDRVLQTILSLFPGSRSFIRSNLEEITAPSPHIVVSCLVIVAWSSTWVFVFVENAMNRAWGVSKRRTFWQSRFRSFAILSLSAILLLRQGRSARGEDERAAGEQSCT